MKHIYRKGKKWNVYIRDGKTKVGWVNIYLTIEATSPKHMEGIKKDLRRDLGYRFGSLLIPLK